MGIHCESRWNRLVRKWKSRPGHRMLATARAAAQIAYVPYSNFPVGAAVLAASGTVYTGCNIENASFGLTICAERTAVFAAVNAEKPSAGRCRVVGTERILNYALRRLPSGTQ